VAQAGTQARPREQRPHTAGRAIEAIGEDPPDPIRGLLLACSALELAIRLGESYRAGLHRVPQMPHHTATDNRGQIDLLSETATVLFVSQEIDWQGQPTPGQDGHQTVVAERTDEAVECHRRDVADHRAPFQTETTMGGQEGITSHFWAHLTIAQDEVGEDREHGAARGALEPPDGDPTEPDTHVMRVAG
jgi:hypothetical protein